MGKAQNVLVLTAMLIDARRLPAMAFYGPQYNADKFEPVVSASYRELKPYYGFWASPLLDSGITAWEKWCNDEHYTHHNGGKGKEIRQTVVIKADARVYMIDSDTDVTVLEQNYHWDWEKIAQDYDAVFVVGEGVWAMCSGSWDLDSILFFNTECFSVGESN